MTRDGVSPTAEVLELKAMGPEKEIVLHEDLAHFILCSRIRYFEDAYFTRRLLPQTAVRPLRI